MKDVLKQGCIRLAGYTKKVLAFIACAVILLGMFAIQGSTPVKAIGQNDIMTILQGMDIAFLGLEECLVGDPTVVAFPAPGITMNVDASISTGDVSDLPPLVLTFETTGNLKVMPIKDTHGNPLDTNLEIIDESDPRRLILAYKGGVMSGTVRTIMSFILYFDNGNTPFGVTDRVTLTSISCGDVTINRGEYGWGTDQSGTPITTRTDDANTTQIIKAINDVQPPVLSAISAGNAVAIPASTSIVAGGSYNVPAGIEPYFTISASSTAPLSGYVYSREAVITSRFELIGDKVGFSAASIANFKSGNPTTVQNEINQWFDYSVRTPSAGFSVSVADANTNYVDLVFKWTGYSDSSLTGTNRPSVQVVVKKVPFTQAVARTETILSTDNYSLQMRNVIGAGTIVSGIGSYVVPLGGTVADGKRMIGSEAPVKLAITKDPQNPAPQVNAWLNSTTKVAELWYYTPSESDPTANPYGLPGAGKTARKVNGVDTKTTANLASDGSTFNWTGDNYPNRIWYTINIPTNDSSWDLDTVTFTEGTQTYYNINAFALATGINNGATTQTVNYYTGSAWVEVVNSSGNLTAEGEIYLIKASETYDGRPIFVFNTAGKHQIQFIFTNVKAGFSVAKSPMVLTEVVSTLRSTTTVSNIITPRWTLAGATPTNPNNITGSAGFIYVQPAVGGDVQSWVDDITKEVEPWRYNSTTNYPYGDAPVGTGTSTRTTVSNTAQGTGDNNPDRIWFSYNIPENNTGTAITSLTINEQGHTSNDSYSYKTNHLRAIGFMPATITGGGSLTLQYTRDGSVASPTWVNLITNGTVQTALGTYCTTVTVGGRTAYILTTTYQGNSPNSSFRFTYSNMTAATKFTAMPRMLFSALDQPDIEYLDMENKLPKIGTVEGVSVTATIEGVATNFIPTHVPSATVRWINADYFNKQWISGITKTVRTWYWSPTGDDSLNSIGCATESNRQGRTYVSDPIEGGDPYSQRIWFALNVPRNTTGKTFDVLTLSDDTLSPASYDTNSMNPKGFYPGVLPSDVTVTSLTVRVYAGGAWRTAWTGNSLGVGTLAAGAYGTDIFDVVSGYNGGYAYVYKGDEKYPIQFVYAGVPSNFITGSGANAPAIMMQAVSQSTQVTELNLENTIKPTLTYGGKTVGSFGGYHSNKGGLIYRTSDTLYKRSLTSAGNWMANEYAQYSIQYTSKMDRPKVYIKDTPVSGLGRNTNTISSVVITGTAPSGSAATTLQTGINNISLDNTVNGTSNTVSSGDTTVTITRTITNISAFTNGSAGYTTLGADDLLLAFNGVPKGVTITVYLTNNYYTLSNLLIDDIVRNDSYYSYNNSAWIGPASHSTRIGPQDTLTKAKTLSPSTLQDAAPGTEWSYTITYNSSYAHTWYNTSNAGAGLYIKDTLGSNLVLPAGARATISMSFPNPNNAYGSVFPATDSVKNSYNGGTPVTSTTGSAGTLRQVKTWSGVLPYTGTMPNGESLAANEFGFRIFSTTTYSMGNIQCHIPAGTIITITISAQVNPTAVYTVANQYLNNTAHVGTYGRYYRTATTGNFLRLIPPQTTVIKDAYKRSENVLSKYDPMTGTFGTSATPLTGAVAHGSEIDYVVNYYAYTAHNGISLNDRFGSVNANERFHRLTGSSYPVTVILWNDSPNVLNSIGLTNSYGSRTTGGGNRAVYFNNVTPYSFNTYPNNLEMGIDITGLVPAGTRITLIYSVKAVPSDDLSGSIPLDTNVINYLHYRNGNYAAWQSTSKTLKVVGESVTGAIRHRYVGYHFTGPDADDEMQMVNINQNILCQITGGVTGIVGEVTDPVYIYEIPRFYQSASQRAQLIPTVNPSDLMYSAVKQSYDGNMNPDGTAEPLTDYSIDYFNSTGVKINTGGSYNLVDVCFIRIQFNGVTLTDRDMIDFKLKMQATGPLTVARIMTPSRVYFLGGAGNQFGNIIDWDGKQWQGSAGSWSSAVVLRTVANTGPGGPVHTASTFTIPYIVTNTKELTISGTAPNNTNTTNTSMSIPVVTVHRESPELVLAEDGQTVNYTMAVRPPQPVSSGTAANPITGSTQVGNNTAYVFLVPVGQTYQEGSLVANRYEFYSSNGRAPNPTRIDALNLGVVSNTRQHAVTNTPPASNETPAQTYLNGTDYHVYTDWITVNGQQQQRLTVVVSSSIVLECSDEGNLRSMKYNALFINFDTDVDGDITMALTEAEGSAPYRLYASIYRPFNISGGGYGGVHAFSGSNIGTDDTPEIVESVNGGQEFNGPAYWWDWTNIVNDAHKPSIGFTRFTVSVNGKYARNVIRPTITKEVIDGVSGGGPNGSQVVPVTPGGVTLNFKLTYSADDQPDSKDMTDFWVIDVLPYSCEYRGMLFGDPEPDLIYYNSAGQQVLAWYVELLEKGEEATLTYSAHVPEGPIGYVNSRAYVMSDQFIPYTWPPFTNGAATRVTEHDMADILKEKLGENKPDFGYDANAAISGASLLYFQNSIYALSSKNVRLYDDPSVKSDAYTREIDALEGEDIVFSYLLGNNSPSRFGTYSDITIYDLLPCADDQTMLTSFPRNSAYSFTMASDPKFDVSLWTLDVNGEPNNKIRTLSPSEYNVYSVNSIGSYPGNVSGWAGLSWVPFNPANSSDVKALKFELDGNIELDFKQGVVIEWVMTAPEGLSRRFDKTFAYNTGAFQLTFNRNDNQSVYAAEPQKVGVRLNQHPLQDIDFSKTLTEDYMPEINNRGGSFKFKLQKLSNVDGQYHDFNIAADPEAGVMNKAGITLNPDGTITATVLSAPATITGKITGLEPGTYRLVEVLSAAEEEYIFPSYMHSDGTPTNIVVLEKVVVVTETQGIAVNNVRDSSLIKYGINYHANGTNVTGLPEDTVHSNGSDADISELIPSRDNYEFKHWTTEPNGSGDIYSPSDIIYQIEADVDLYAQWEPKIFNITYLNLQGSTNASSNPATYKYGTGVASFAEPIESTWPNGKIFAGWWSEDGTSSGEWGTQITSISTTATGDKTLYAKWDSIPATVTVKYHYNGVYDNTADASVTGKFVGDQVVTGDIQDKSGAYYRLAATPYSPSLPYTIASATGTVINVYYVSDAATVTVKYHYNGVYDDTADESITGKFVGDRVASSEIIQKTKTYYTLSSYNPSLPYTITAATGNVINVYYVSDAATVTVKYHYNGVYDDTADESITGKFVGDQVASSEITQKTKTYYTLSSYNPALPYAITAATGNVINVYYVSDAATVTVKYHYNGVYDNTADESVTGKFVGDQVVTGDIQDKSGTYYRLAATPYSPSLPYTITSASGNEINVYYVSDAATVTVKYHYNGVYDNTADESVTGKFVGDRVASSEITQKTKTYYTLSSYNPSLPYTITAATGNEINVYYVSDAATVTVKYHYNGVYDNTADESVTGKFVGDRVTTGDIQDKSGTYYRLADTPYSPSLPYTITSATGNEINVYYVSDAATVTVKYWYNGTYATGEDESITGKFVGDKVTAGEIIDKSGTYYDLDATTPYSPSLPHTITAATGNVINVYYIADEFDIIINYYKRSIEAGNKIVTVTIRVVDGTNILSAIEEYFDDLSVDDWVNYRQPNYYNTGTDPEIDPDDIVNGSSVTYDILYTVDQYDITIDYYERTIEAGNKIGSTVTITVDNGTNIQEAIDEYFAELLITDWVNARKPQYFNNGTVDPTIGASDIIDGSGASYDILYEISQYDIVLKYYKDDVEEGEEIEIVIITVDNGTDILTAIEDYFDGLSVDDWVNYKRPRYYNSGSVDPTINPGDIVEDGSVSYDILYDIDQFDITIEYYKDSIEAANKIGETVIITVDNGAVIEDAIEAHFAGLTRARPDWVNWNRPMYYEEGILSPELDPSDIIDGSSVAYRILYKGIEIDYTVKYWFDDEYDASEDEIFTGRFAITVSHYPAKGGSNYLLDPDRAQNPVWGDGTYTDKLILDPNDSSKNVINVYYVSKDVTYTVVYHHNGIETSRASDLPGKANRAIASVEDRAGAGYQLYAIDPALPFMLSANPAKNVINVYYIGDDIGYIVEYFFNDEPTPRYDLTYYGSADVDETVDSYPDPDIDDLDKYVWLETIWGDNVSNTELVISSNNEENVIRVYYEGVPVTYDVEYYFNGKRGITVPGLTGRYGERIRVSDWDDYSDSVYTLDEENSEDIILGLDDNVLKVYYTSKSTTYTVKYYFNYVPGDSPRYVNENQPGFENDVIDITDLDFYSSEIYELDVRLTRDSYVIVLNPALNVIEIYYISASTEYTIEYYFNGVKNAGLTETITEYGQRDCRVNDTITDLTSKSFAGYELDRVEGLPLTLSADSSDNVIKVYYTSVEKPKGPATGDVDTWLFGIPMLLSILTLAFALRKKRLIKEVK